MKLNVIATSLVLSSALFSGATLAADGDAANLLI